MPGSSAAALTRDQRREHLPRPCPGVVGPSSSAPRSPTVKIVIADPSSRSQDHFLVLLTCADDRNALISREIRSRKNLLLAPALRHIWHGSGRVAAPELHVGGDG